jgi:hypothetical protein
MPVISVGVTVPGTQIHVGAQIAHQTQREKMADRAMDILEKDAREHTGEKAADRVATKFDEFLSSPGLLDRLGHDHGADG